MSQLPSVGSDIIVWVYSYIREDSIRLFGFESYQDRYTFEVLIGLNGVGPKVALAILSHLHLPAIQQAVLLDQSYIFEAVPGVGKRLAEKIIVELKSKIKKLEAASDMGVGFSGRKKAEDFNSVLNQGGSDGAQKWANMMEDLKSALENLGYKDKQIAPIIKELLKDDPIDDFRILLKSALKLIQSNRSGAQKTSSKARKIVEKELF